MAVPGIIDEIEDLADFVTTIDRAIAGLDCSDTEHSAIGTVARDVGRRLRALSKRLMAERDAKRAAE